MSFRTVMKNWYDPAVSFKVFDNNPKFSSSNGTDQEDLAPFSFLPLNQQAIPIYVVMGTAVGGATWYLSRLARGPDIVWDRHNNPRPWLDVQPGQNTKMMTVNQEFPNGDYKRSKI